MSALIHVFYDGRCGFCRRTMRALHTLDWIRQLHGVDFNDEKERMRYASDIPLAQLDLALHIRTPEGRTEKGFSAFRFLCWYLPPLWILIPFLYVPGATLIGDRVYAAIAEGRKRCTHESCAKEA